MDNIVDIMVRQTVVPYRLPFSSLKELGSTSINRHLGGDIVQGS